MYERLKERYAMGYVRPDQLRRYVELEVITPEEYLEICGEELHNA